MNVKHYEDKKFALFIFDIGIYEKKKLNIKITMKKLLNYAYDYQWAMGLPCEASN